MSRNPCFAARCNEVLLLFAKSGFWRACGLLRTMRRTSNRSLRWIARRSRMATSIIVVVWIRSRRGILSYIVLFGFRGRGGVLSCKSKPPPAARRSTMDGVHASVTSHAAKVGVLFRHRRRLSSIF